MLEPSRPWPAGECERRRHGARRYEGEWRHDRRHGRGAYQWVAARAAPPQRAVELRGGKKAAARARSGRHSYTGEWARGQRSGQGRMEYPGGWSYEGEWKEDRRDGVGLLAGPDGYRYKGAFIADRPHGQGGSEPSQLLKPSQQGL